jgi:NADPH-dependent 2,4-dienoyl-CoA reductase/sulfur reductase-like enzyme
MCIDSIYTSGAAYCIHNPSSGRELEVPQLVAPSAAVRRVAVVGGGPAGLEAARVAGERGHDVTLFEASSALGGQLALAARSPRRRDLQGIVDWRAQELERLGVKVHLDTYAEADTLAAGGFDVIVVATGGLPGIPDVPGARLVVDGWDVVSGAKRLGGRVLVYDDHGGNQALDVTETLLRSGAEVELVTPERTVSPEVGALVGAGYFVALADGGVRQTVLRRLLSVERTPDGLLVTLGAEGASRTETRLVDAVVAEVGTVAVADVYDELVAGSVNHGEVRLEDLLGLRPQSAVRNPAGTYQLFRIGDAVAGRNVHAAMLDAARLARAL